MPEPDPARQPSPIRPTDDDARRLGRALIDGAAFGALAVLHPDTGLPHVTRIAIAAGPCGHPVTLISELSLHTRALLADPRASVLLGEPGPRGDPLTHPRITLQVLAEFLRHGTPDHAALRAHYLRRQPKAKLYVDFADFAFARLRVQGAALNGGFGKAFDLAPADLGL
jgi:hypothetical protein